MAPWQQDLLRRGPAAAVLSGHRRMTQGLYVSLCLAGLFAPAPSRYLGGVLLVQGLAAYSTMGQIMRDTPLWNLGALASVLALGWRRACSKSAGPPRLALSSGALSISTLTISKNSPANTKSTS